MCSVYAADDLLYLIVNISLCAFVISHGSVTTGNSDEPTNGLNVPEDYFDELNSADTLNFPNVNFNSQYYELGNIRESRFAEYFQYKPLHWNIRIYFR